MGTISEKLTYLNETKQELKQAINNIGGEVTDETTFREYVEELQDIYDNLPKTDFEEGTSITLENCNKGKLDFVEGKVGYGQTSQKILPSEYQQVEYIESDGNQYINSGRYITNNNVKLEIKVKPTNYFTGVEMDIVSNQPNESGRLVVGYFDKKIFMYSRSDSNHDQNVWSGEIAETEDIIINVNYDYTNHLKTLNINGTSLSSQMNATISNNIQPLHIGMFRADSRKFTGKYYYIRIYENNEISMDLYPCYRISDNVIGMYDIVNNVFHTNSGTGTFTKGADAPTPNQEIPINSVTGNQEVVVRGKNLLNIYNTRQAGYSVETNGITFTWNDDGSISISGTSTSANAYIDIYSSTTKIIGKPGERITYCLLENTSNDVVCHIYDYADGTYKNNNAGTIIAGHTNLSNATGSLIRIIIPSNNVTINQKVYPIIVEGAYSSSNLPTYEPYKTPKTYQLSLGEYEFNGIGNYKDELIYDVDEDRVYKNEKIKKKSITDIIGLRTVTYNSTYSQFVITQNPLPDLANNSSYADQYYTPTFLCNSYKASTFINALTSTGYLVSYLYVDVENNRQLRFKNADTSDVDIFKTSVANDYLVYPLATPVEIPITDTTLINQVKAWYNAQSIKGTTIIESNGDLPLIIKARALKGE